MYTRLGILALFAAGVGTVPFQQDRDSLFLENNEIETRSITSYGPNSITHTRRSISTPIYTDNLFHCSTADTSIQPRAEGQKQAKHGSGGGSKKQGLAKPKAGGQHSQRGHNSGAQNKMNPKNRIRPIDTNNSKSQNSHPTAKPGINPVNGLPAPKGNPKSHSTAGTNPVNGLPAPTGHPKSCSTAKPGINPVNGLPAPGGKPAHASTPKYAGTGFNPNKHTSKTHPPKSHPSSTAKSNPTPKFLRKHPSHSLNSASISSLAKAHPTSAGTKITPIVTPKVKESESHSDYRGQLNNPNIHPNKPAIRTYFGHYTLSLNPTESSKDKGQGVIGTNKPKQQGVIGTSKPKDQGVIASKGHMAKG